MFWKKRKPEKGQHFNTSYRRYPGQCVVSIAESEGNVMIKVKFKVYFKVKFMVKFKVKVKVKSRSRLRYV
jgi:hypothetical protein